MQWLIFSSNAFPASNNSPNRRGPNSQATLSGWQINWHARAFSHRERTPLSPNCWPFREDFLWRTGPFNHGREPFAAFVDVEVNRMESLENLRPQPPQSVSRSEPKVHALGLHAVISFSALSSLRAYFSLTQPIAEAQPVIQPGTLRCSFWV